ncbi:MAG: response regulator receiver protein [Caulobacteraceae bacterium]|nr:response regulator receiver protein [Caulobacteraceae bacterium]
MTRIVQPSETAIPTAAKPHPGLREGRLFLDAVSGEIRRPMHSILAVAELLARQPLSPDALAYVRTIIDHSHSLLRTVDDAKDLVRSETEPLVMQPSAVSLHELMDAIQGQWQAKAALAGVALLVSYDGEEIVAMLDGRRLRQVFDHLIEHALKMTRKGGVEVSLRARASDQDVVVEGSVRDSGVGLAPDKLARIFEPAAGEGESRVGLALCRRVIEAMSGSIRAESNVGAGSTIAFGLVVQRAEAPKSDDLLQSKAVRTAHVLVVDDNATNRMVAEALCEMFDCTSESAEDGLQAVEAVKSGRFDLVLMDIKMPRMDGVQATRVIRDMPGATGQVPIIALTANADPEDARGYIASGMSCVVEKPIKAEALLQAMTSCLSNRDAGQSSAASAAAA